MVPSGSMRNRKADTPGWDADNVRNATWIKLRYKKSGLIFFCFNTRFSVKERPAGKGSAALMVDKIKEIAGDDAVVFVGGDFQMSSSDRIMTSLVSYAKDANYSFKKARHEGPPIMAMESRSRSALAGPYPFPQRVKLRNTRLLTASSVRNTSLTTTRSTPSSRFLSRKGSN